MRRSIFKSQLSKKERREVEQYKRSNNTRFFGSLILFLALFFLYQFNFEFKLISILSESSMIDNTGTLDFFDKRKLKKSMDYIYEKHGIALVYNIGYNEIELPRFTIPTIYIAINPLIEDVLAFVPSQMPRNSLMPNDVIRAAQIELEKGLKTCLFGEDSSIYQNLQNTLNTTNNEMITQDIDIQEKNYSYRAPITFENNLPLCFDKALLGLINNLGG